MTDRFDEVEAIIGYKFKNRDHLMVALTHRSYIHECQLDRVSYERYEYLGDAILEFIVSRELFKKYPEKTEGELERINPADVSEAPYYATFSNPYWVPFIWMEDLILQEDMLKDICFLIRRWSRSQHFLMLKPLFRNIYRQMDRRLPIRLSMRPVLPTIKPIPLPAL